MASISTDKSNRRRLLFIDPAGKRRTLYLGKMPLKAAETVRTRVEHIVASQVSRQALDSDTARWLATLGDDLYRKLAALGLVDRRTVNTLGAWTQQYLDDRTDLKPGSKKNVTQVRLYLVEHFGEHRDLRSITPHDASNWRIWQQRTKKQKDNTLRKQTQIAKQYFAAAVRARLIDSNPFAELPATVLANQDRQHFIPRETADKVLAACPNAEWRLIFALARYGGLRCPSEHLALTWDCVLWDQQRLRVLSPKTEHYPGKASRVIPLFPELLGPLEEVWDQAPEGSKYVIQNYRTNNANLRTHLYRIVDKAGVERWPKPFHNLRASRQTELVDRFPAHVVCAWLGNSQPVAQKHYLQVLDSHFSQATQKTTQPAAEPSCLEGTAEQGDSELSEPDMSSHLQSSVTGIPEGCEHPSVSSQKTAIPAERDAVLERLRALGLSGRLSDVELKGLLRLLGEAV